MSEEAKGSDRLASLLAALIAGAFETPQWRSFLEQLRAAASADYAVMIVTPPGRAMDDGLLLAAGSADPAAVAGGFRKLLYPTESVSRMRTAEGKPVALEDLRPPEHGSASEAYRELVDEFGVAASLQVRVSEPLGVEAWLVIARRKGDFAAGDAGLLADLAAPLRDILRAYVAGEKGRFAAAMAAEAVRRLQCGWILFDQGGHVLASDEFGMAMLDGSGVIGRNAAGRLTLRQPRLERDVLAEIERLASGASTRPRAICLRSDPWLDMLLVAAKNQMISDTAVPAVIAYVHGDNWRSADRCAQLCDLFDLSPSEGRLALAMCRGKSIAEAAVELGLRLETARSYSKSIYAKTGTRGMSDLVRVIMGSVLTLAPDS